MIFYIFLFGSLIIGFYLSNLISKKLNIYDFPTKRKIHHKPVLCIGGIYFFFAIFFSIIIYFLLKNFTNFAISYVSLKFIFNLFLVSFFILILGILDDKNGVDSVKKIILLFIINLFFFSFMDPNLRVYKINSLLSENISIDLIGSVILPSIIFTVFIVFLGLIDGINCILSLISALLLIMLTPFLNYETINFMNIVLFVLIIYLFLFIIVNYKSYFFLGNSGSMLLAFLVALLYYKNYQEINTEIISYIEMMILSIWLIIVDVLRVFAKRISLNKSPFLADRSHFHHILIKRYSLSKSLFIYCTLNFTPILLILFLNT